MENKEKHQELQSRNDRKQAFKENQEKQLERDQLLWPADDLPLEDIKEEKKEERDKHASKNTSSSEKEHI